MTTIKRDSLLGLVFFGGLILILYATYKLSSFSWVPRSKITVYFKHARGLQAGHDVFVLGKKYGNVTKVDTIFTNTKRPIQVTLELVHAITFHEGYRIMILEASFLGGRKVEINPGPSSNPDGSPTKKVDNYLALEGEAPMNAIEALSDFFSGGDNNENFASILVGLRQIVEDVKNQRGTLGKLIMDPEPWNNLAKIIKDIKTSIEDEKGVLGALIHNSKLKMDLESAVENIAAISEQINSGKGTFGKLLRSQKMAIDFEESLANLRKITTKVERGEGAIGKLLMDKPTEERLVSIVKNIEKATTALNDPDAGMFGALLHDETVAKEFKNIAAKLSIVATELAGTKGLLGRLINDPELGDEFANLVKNLARAIEDRREAAPLQTLFSVFGGVFQ